MRTAARVDANQKEIVKGLRGMGAAVLVTSQLKNAFDILVGFRGKLYIMEIKDGTRPPSGRKLTPGEESTSEMFKRVGIKYHIIKDVDEALKVIGLL